MEREWQDNRWTHAADLGQLKVWAGNLPRAWPQGSHDAADYRFVIAGSSGKNPAAEVSMGPIVLSNDDGGSTSIPVIFDAPTLQQPALGLSFQRIDTLGIGLAVRAVTEPDRLELEFALLTVRPVTEISFAATVTIPNCRLEFPLARPAGSSAASLDALDANDSRAIQFSEVDGPVFSAFVDLGESGRLTIENASSPEAGEYRARRLIATFFGRSLEKGVILVGRMSFGPPLPGFPLAVRNAYTAWYESAKFL